ncbi:hypothetical protein HNY73_015352 [Argiope bruennichi]|uniref:Transmembrane protein n=1 Tax=Argiope bruennichi TaxID=94029 RepID=A0A8T0EX86_ARGBR|nr:hypothetical protein HNY73_015352 [Argiope bruennichi]
MDSFELSLESNEILNLCYLRLEEKEDAIKENKECSRSIEVDIIQTRVWLLNGIILLVLGALVLTYSLLQKNAYGSFFVALCLHLFSLSFIITGCGCILNVWFLKKSRNKTVLNATTEQKRSGHFSTTPAANVALDTNSLCTLRGLYARRLPGGIVAFQFRLMDDRISCGVSVTLVFGADIQCLV